MSCYRRLHLDAATSNATSTPRILTMTPYPIAQLLDEGMFTDLIIRLEGHDWRTHKVIVCSESRFFYKACNSDFREAKSNVIELHDDDREDVQRMIEWIYGRPYASDSTIEHDIAMYSLADKYDIPELRAETAEKLKSKFPKASNKELTKIIPVLYSSTPTDETRKTLFNIVMRRDVSPNSRSLELHEAFEAAPDFAIDYAKYMKEHIGTKLCLLNMMSARCPSRNCGATVYAPISGSLVHCNMSGCSLDR